MVEVNRVMAENFKRKMKPNIGCHNYHVLLTLPDKFAVDTRKVCKIANLAKDMRCCYERFSKVPDQQLQ